MVEPNWFIAGTIVEEENTLLSNSTSWDIPFSPAPINQNALASYFWDLTVL
jgi:hypothetical protein